MSHEKNASSSQKREVDVSREESSSSFISLQQQSDALSEHKSQCLIIGNYQWNTCNERCFSECDLARHTLTHMGFWKHTCDICNKSFIVAKDLSDHKLLHDGIKNYKWDICKKIFRTARVLSQHKARHKKALSREYRCDVCYKTFTREIHLEDHKLIHTAIKQYQCCLLYTSRCV